MSTLFDHSFTYVEFAQGSWDENGAYVNGGVSARQVHGTIQTMNAQDAAPYVDGSRNIGFVKVYSSEKLNARKEGENMGGFIFLDGNFFQLLDSMPNLNGLISHYKYVAGLLDVDNVPPEVRSVARG